MALNDLCLVFLLAVRAEAKPGRGTASACCAVVCKSRSWTTTTLSSSPHLLTADQATLV